MEKRKNANKILTGNSEKKRPLGRPIRRWEDNNKINLNKTW